MNNECVYERKIEQSVLPHSQRIAIDDGIPDSKLNKSDLKEIALNATCLGTYSYIVETIDGETTRVAIEVTKGPLLNKETKI